MKPNNLFKLFAHLCAGVDEHWNRQVGHSFACRQLAAVSNLWGHLCVTMYVGFQVYRSINNGVYRCGFSTSQAGYDVAVGELHQLMGQLDEQLGQTRFLLGDRYVDCHKDFNACYVACHVKLPVNRQQWSLWHQAPGLAEMSSVVISSALCGWASIELCCMRATICV